MEISSYIVKLLDVLAESAEPKSRQELAAQMTSLAGEEDNFW